MSRLDPRFAYVRLVVCDVDGTLTDGGMIYDAHGCVSKRFHVRDGLGVRLLQAAGVKVAWVTSDDARAVVERAERLGVAPCLVGVRDKVAVVRSLADDTGIPLQEVAFIGDDLQDLAVMRVVGLPVAVADAVEEVRNVARYVCRAPGGNGAFREFAELLISSRGLDATHLIG